MNTSVAVSWPLNLSAAIVRKPLTVAPDISVKAVVAQMAEARAGAEAAIMPHHGLHDCCSDRSSCVLIMDSEQVQGLFTEHDVLRLVSQNATLDRLTIREVMTPSRVTMRESVLSDAMAVLHLFQQYDTHYLLLADEQGQFTGVITQYALRQLLKFGTSTVQQSSTSNKRPLAVTSTLGDVPVQNRRQSSFIGICRTNIEGEITYLNDRYCEILGLSAEAMVSEAWCWGIPINDRKRVLLSKRTIDHSCQLEYQFQRSDGDIVWLHEHYVAERNEEGHVVGFVSTLADISDRKRSEAALIQSEAHKQAILTAIPDYLFRVDACGVYREVVAHKPEITLFPANINPLGLSMKDVLPGAVAVRQQFYLAETLRTGQLKTYEQQFQVCGQLRDEEVRVIKSGDDEALFMVRDISDRKRAERQLQSLIEGTAATTGQDFFPALVRHIAASLDVAYAVINELVDGQLRALAFWAHGEPHAPIFYCPTSTPCERTLKQGKFYCESLQPEDFPGEINLIEMGVESYLGIALYDSQGNVIGNLCILHSQPIHMPHRAEQILQVFAARAAAELERQRAIVSLEQLNHALEVKVAERTGELQEREQFLQTVLDTFPLGVFWKDLNSSYLGCNRYFLQDAGLASIDELIGKTDYDMLWDEAYAACAQKEDRDIMQFNTAKLGIEKTLIDSHGQQIWIETNKLPLRNLSGEVVGVLGTYQDITDRKQLELDLQSSKNQLSEVLDTANAGIVRLQLYPDASMHYEYISPYCAENLGFTVAELLSEPGLWQSRVHPDDWDEVIGPKIQAILSTRSTSTYAMEYRFYRKDGTICWFLANLFTQWNAAETCWDVTVVDTDISDRKKAEAQLQHLLAGTATTIGQDFFPALVGHIAEALQVTHVLVVELVDGSMHTLAFWNQGELQANFRYPLENNPCLQTIQKGHFYCHSNIQQQFPLCFSLVEMEVESYIGVVLKDQEDQVIGVLCLYHQQPMPDIQSVMQTLQIFATRASVELERQRASIALEQLNQALEVKVAERTAELREREQFLQTVLNTFPLAVFWKNRQSVYLGCNSNFLANTGLTSLAELMGKTDYDLPWIMTIAEAHRTDDVQVMEANTPKLGIVQTLDGADGKPIWLETNKLPLHNLEGEVIGVLGTYQDITERKHAEIAIKRQLAAMEAAIDGIGILENDAYIYVNKAYLNLFAYGQPEELLGKTWYSLYSTEENLRFERDVLPALESYRAWQGEAIATRKDGTTFVQGVSLTLMEDGLLICVCRDISALKQAQAQIIHNALHDPLTGLPNRTLLIERIELAIQTANYLPNYQYALLFLDLDRFKVINDSLGHVVGDQLLVEVSKRLQQCVREIDMVARLGGDEFVILLDNIQYLDDIVHVVERILEDCQTPILIDDQKIFTSASIGIALGNRSYHQASTLIRNADIAMYRAKAQESNSYKFFDEVMHAEAVSRLTLETDLRRALLHQEFVVHYQPIVSLWNSALVGFEALVRWQHPTRGLVTPDEFIPVLEDTGLVSSLDSWVMHEACRQMCCWQRQFPQWFPLKISINLSALDLRSTNLLQTIDTILQNTGLSGDSIVLEITESMLIEDIDKTTDVLIDLAAKRIQVSIDDFGTGYSSLGYLHRLPVHHLKIDRSFVSQMHVDNRNYQVVSTILAMSQQLGLAVVAEGIEVIDHLQSLQQLGCQFGQGHLFSPPLTATEVERLLSRSQLTL